jgi:hypothetical protein
MGEGAGDEPNAAAIRENSLDGERATLDVAAG